MLVDLATEEGVEDVLLAGVILGVALGVTLGVAELDVGLTITTELELEA